MVSARIGREAYATTEYLRRVLQAQHSGSLRSRDIDRAFQGAYLEFYVFLEEQIEFLFYGLLMGRLVATGVKPKVTVRSELGAKMLVLGDRSYADWLPISKTIDRAAVFFHSGAPFSRLDDGHRSTLQEMKFIRDAIAHSGSHAADRFRRSVIGSRPIPTRERAPARYLAGLHAGHRTRMDELIARASLAMLRLCE